MKILVFEYITGGGFNKQELSDSLVKEGSLMRNALLDNLNRLNQTRLNSLEITVMLDWRLNNLVGMTGVNIVTIRPEHDITEEFARLVKQCDLVWPIAPEFDGILQALCQTVESLGKILLTSPATAVTIAGNKLKTYELLNQHHIAAVPTCTFESVYTPGEWMVKPINGVGCEDSYVLTSQLDFERMAMRKGQYIIQPHLQGTKTSLSCLFKQGSGWLVCANLQRFEFINQQYHLTDIVVNHYPDLGLYQQLIDKIAQALPELWGYAGIDLIENDTTCVLEINPRLTTSFVGIHDALGINIAEAVLQLLHGEPMINPVYSRPITVEAKQETHAS
ncbi:MAG: ATP-grasp domain-containing protein [Methylobacter sp.]